MAWHINDKVSHITGYRFFCALIIFECQPNELTSISLFQALTIVTAIH